ncbi:outer membrane protein assembly factor BamE [Woodsholea maritima]|uniref:outer membrane protein assembly factor BamE n=1 Tax=Woodsholea maritima TaxID=240237 RepID=UPI000377C063|nr:outer membrane protein assembly factor BamE [Woodsholea maritima]
MSFPRTRIAALGLLVISAGLLSACNPTLRSHGFRYTDGEVPEILVGQDTQASVMSTLGNPSTRGVFETDTWYYISATRETLAYRRPETRDRRIIAVRFDDNGVVSAVDEFGLENGRVVAVVGRETPTRGRELTILEQILGNVGRLPTEQFGGEQNLPGGAGGPRTDGGR